MLLQVAAGRELEQAEWLRCAGGRGRAAVAAPVLLQVAAGRPVGATEEKALWVAPQTPRRLYELRV